MKIDYNLYHKNNLVIPAIMLILVVVYLVYNIYLLFKNLHTSKSHHYYVFALVVGVLFLIPIFASLPRGLNLITEKASDTVITEGTVTNIERIQNSPRYYIDGEPCRAVWICIEDKKYYMVDTHDLSVGDKVQLTYLKNSRFVIEYDKEWENEGE